MLRFFLALFVCILLTHASAEAQQKRAAPSAALQTEYDQFIGKFRAALKVNDATAVTAMTRLPFYYDDARRDGAYFRAKAYPFYFNAKNRACIQRSKGVYDRDGEKNDNFFIFCGQQIFVFTKTPGGFLFTEVSAND